MSNFLNLEKNETKKFIIYIKLFVWVTQALSMLFNVDLKRETSPFEFTFLIIWLIFIVVKRISENGSYESSVTVIGDLNSSYVKP